MDSFCRRIFSRCYGCPFQNIFHFWTTIRLGAAVCLLSLKICNFYMVQRESATKVTSWQTYTCDIRHPFASICVSRAAQRSHRVVNFTKCQFESPFFTVDLILLHVMQMDLIFSRMPLYTITHSMRARVTEKYTRYLRIVHLFTCICAWRGVRPSFQEWINFVAYRSRTTYVTHFM